MYPILIVAFLAVFTSALDTFPVTQKFVLNATIGAQVFTFQANLKNTATVSVVSPADLVFCFQEQYSLFTNSTPVISTNSAYWSAQNCRFFFKSAGGVNATEQKFPFSMVPYAVAIFFQNASSAATEITLSITGDVCGANEIVDVTGACIAATLITTQPVVVPASTPMVAYNFRLSATKVTGSFTIACEAGNQLSYWIARDVSPVNSAPVTKYTCATPYTLDNPRNGLNGYYLLVANEQNVTQSFTVTFNECTNYTGGKDCKTPISNATAVPELMLFETTTYYFKLDASSSVAVWASVRGVNGTLTNVVNPLIFASLNQLPQADNADVTVCNQYYCDLVNAINFNVSSNQTWYIGIQNPYAIYNGSKAGIWFNSVCAPGCSDHGECALAGPQMGYCDCIDGFIGVDCNTANGFGPQFIVLIIIAVLVALTAVIGFGAWAYMRRKRGQYDIVS